MLIASPTVLHLTPLPGAPADCHLPGREKPSYHSTADCRKPLADICKTFPWITSITKPVSSAPLTPSEPTWKHI